MKPLTEWACHLKNFINSSNVAPPARDDSFTTLSRTVFKALLGFEVLGCFRLPAALGFRAALPAAGSGLASGDPQEFGGCGRH